MKKIKLALVGASGRMGKEVIECLKDERDFELVWSGSTRQAADLKSLVETKADVLLDFSQPASTLKWIDAFKKQKQKTPPALICSTGFSKPQLSKIKSALKNSKYALVPNTSLGVLALKKAVEAVLPVLDSRYTVELIESHHTHKKDAPSGTALHLEKAAKQSRKTKKLSVNTHAVRAGSDPGTHTLHIWGPHEQITLKHQAESRRLFASGALHCCKKLLATRKRGPFEGIESFV